MEEDELDDDDEEGCDDMDDGVLEDDGLGSDDGEQLIHMDDDEIVQEAMGSDEECLSDVDDPKLNSKEKKKKLKSKIKEQTAKPLQIKPVNTKGLKRGKTVLNPSIKVTI